LSEKIKDQKESVRSEAKRVRDVLSLDADEYDRFEELFYKTIPLDQKSVVGAYWPKGREFDVRMLIDDMLKKNHVVALPVMEDDSRVLKFIRCSADMELKAGKYGIMQPEINEDTEYLEPDIFIVPMLAFDRQGNRMGYGGGYYDSTLEHYAEQKDILCVGVAYAQQACLFNLPIEEHDRQMDYIITQQDAFEFKE
tara:strand:+ start:1494 stop:2081 length:588 start_codon:yes stop_codon:yes gene_type:complete